MRIAFWRRRKAARLAEGHRTALAALVRGAKFELIPLRNALERAADLPPNATVTVTASPSHGIEATFDLCEALVGLGHEVVPHLSAHMVRDAGHLAELLARARVGGIRRVFVVGGDAKDAGAFHDGLSLLRAMDEHGHPFEEIGVPAYPEGHVDIADEALVRALLDKQGYASYMTTQMCFEPKAVDAWIRRVRARGVHLAVHVGTPGVADLTRLLTIAARIGIADSARYLKKNRTMIGHVMRNGSFGPDAFLEALAPTIARPDAEIRALHLFTFNQVQTTVEWQRGMLAELGG